MEENIYGDRWYEQAVELAQGFPVLVKTEVSRRGNGVMSIKNLQLRLYDAHDDAAYFENWLLRTEFVDLNGDGCGFSGEDSEPKGTEPLPAESR